MLEFESDRRLQGAFQKVAFIRHRRGVACRSVGLRLYADLPSWLHGSGRCARAASAWLLPGAGADRAPQKEVDRRVVAVYFDKNRRVQRLADYGLKEGRIFDYISRTTPSGGAEQNYLGLMFKIFKS